VLAESAMRGLSDECDRREAALDEAQRRLALQITGASHTQRAELRAQVREDVRAISEQVDALRAQSEQVQRQHALRLTACHEGLRESRLELGDVMQSLHYLTERSEIQHLVNQLIARASLPPAPTWKNTGGYEGVGGGGMQLAALLSPRGGGGGGGGRPEPLPPPGRRAHQQAMEKHHRCCIKKSECNCGLRLGLGFAGPEPTLLTLERLFDQQWQLLFSVRKVWRQAEMARGELPSLPRLPPLQMPDLPTDGSAGVEPFLAALDANLVSNGAASLLLEHQKQLPVDWAVAQDELDS